MVRISFELIEVEQETQKNMPIKSKYFNKQIARSDFINIDVRLDDGIPWMTKLLLLQDEIGKLPV